MIKLVNSLVSSIALTMIKFFLKCVYKPGLLFTFKQVPHESHKWKSHTKKSSKAYGSFDSLATILLPLASFMAPETRFENSGTTWVLRIASIWELASTWGFASS